MPCVGIWVSSPTRSLRRTAVATALQGLPDDDLSRLLATAGTRGARIGGATAVLEVDGTRVFVKRLALTDLEQQPEHRRSTANLFRLPRSCHYGVGAPAASAWRELRVHQLVTQWVLDGGCDGFPLLYHWRVLPQDPRRGLDCAEHGDLDTWVAFWHGSAAVRQRLEALSHASADLVLFLEHVPQTLLSFLADRHQQGPEVLDAVLGSVESQLVRVARWMASYGLRHFDAHLRNIVVDRGRLYVTDFGLASSTAFQVTATEADFLNSHAEHDIAYVVKELVNWVVTSLTELSRTSAHPAQRNDVIRACAAGARAPLELLPAAAAIVRRYAPVAVVMNDFYFDLHATSRRTAYPEADVRYACAIAGIALTRPERSAPPSGQGSAT
jgi:hypothetical protein